MPDALIYFWIAIATLIVLIHLWAIDRVFRSEKNLSGKIRWMLCIGLLPVLGLVIWSFAGQHDADDDPQSPEYGN